MTVGVLCAAQFAQGAARAGAQDGGMDATHGPSVITIDNSNADSWLEVDRTLNTLAPLSKGTAGSDHDGGGGAVEQHAAGGSSAQLQAAPVERGRGPEDRESAAAGDDAEGGADRETTPAAQKDLRTGSTGGRGTNACAPSATAPRGDHPVCP